MWNNETASAFLRNWEKGQLLTAGTVLRVRDGVADKLVPDQTDREAITGTECGNGAIVDHGNGWETQYCHLHQGSLAVKPGTEVEKGTVLGMVGASGLASFPHVHLTLRYQGQIVDPFVGVNPKPGCQVTRHPLWERTLDYVPTGLIRAGFAPQPPEQAAALARAVWGRSIGTKYPCSGFLGSCLRGFTGGCRTLQAECP
ncbi:MAG: M23 family metallopeptidase [Microcystaceae cyanobacterium]